MDRHAARNRDILACLSDASRFRLALSLLEGERCVTELAAAVGLSQSCTTRHLQYLEREGLVRGMRQGKRVVFRLRSDQARVRELLAWATSASPDTVARQVSGGDIHMEHQADSRTPSAKRPRLPARAAAGVAKETGDPEASQDRPPPPDSGVPPGAETEGGASAPNAGTDASHSEMEDWLL